MTTVLHAGCGGAPLPEWVPCDREVRLDINPDMKPDIVASMVDMAGVDDESVDVVYTSHSLEHLYPLEVDQCLRSVVRVLRPGGALFVCVPNLEGITPDEEVVYEAECGPVTGRDMFYGHHKFVMSNPHMTHRTGFIPSTLAAALERAGLRVRLVQGDKNFNLLGVAVRPRGEPEER